MNRVREPLGACPFGDDPLFVQVADLIVGHLQEQKVRDLPLVASMGHTEGPQHTAVVTRALMSRPTPSSGVVQLRRCASSAYWSRGTFLSSTWRASIPANPVTSNPSGRTGSQNTKKRTFTPASIQVAMWPASVSSHSACASALPGYRLVYKAEAFEQQKMVGPHPLWSPGSVCP